MEDEIKCEHTRYNSLVKKTDASTGIQVRECQNCGREYFYKKGLSFDSAKVVRTSSGPAESNPVELSSYLGVKGLIHNLPQTWIPALMAELVAVGIEKKAFVPGLTHVFVRKTEEKILGRKLDAFLEAVDDEIEAKFKRDTLVTNQKSKKK